VSLTVITQSTLDRLLLVAINAFFNYVGTVHDKAHGVSVLTFRNMKVRTERLKRKGIIRIPRARIDLSGLPGGTALPP
jgi:hypothetical protein